MSDHASRCRSSQAPTPASRPFLFVLATAVAACGSAAEPLAPTVSQDPRTPEPGPTVATFTFDPLTALNMLGTMGSARGINFGAVITGRIKIPIRGSVPRFRAFRYSALANSVTILPVLPGYLDCEGVAINDAETIVGTCFGGVGVNRAFSWSAGGGLVPLTAGVGSWAHAVDPSGVVVGAYRTKLNQVHAARWLTNSTVVDLHPTGADSSRAVGRNASGDMAFNAWYPGGRMTALRLRAGSLGGPVALPPLVKGGWTMAGGINGLGNVAGSAATDVTHASGTVWPIGLAPLLVPGSNPTVALAINDKERVVGKQGLFPGYGTAFTLDRSGNLINLSVPNEDAIAYGLTGCNVVVGETVSHTTGNTRAVLWRPNSCDP